MVLFLWGGGCCKNENTSAARLYRTMCKSYVTQLLTGASMHSRNDCSAAMQPVLPKPEDCQQAAVERVSSFSVRAKRRRTNGIILNNADITPRQGFTGFLLGRLILSLEID